MIIADTAAASKSWSVYSNFKQEVNFCHDQNWYKWIIRNWSQSFYFTQLYYVAEDLNFDNENIYYIDSNQIQDNQNFNSEQKKSEQNESDTENYFADHVDIFISKTRIC